MDAGVQVWSGGGGSAQLREAAGSYHAWCLPSRPLPLTHPQHGRHLPVWQRRAAAAWHTIRFPCKPSRPRAQRRGQQRAAGRRRGAWRCSIGRCPCRLTASGAWVSQQAGEQHGRRCSMACTQDQPWRCRGSWQPCRQCGPWAFSPQQTRGATAASFRGWRCGIAVVL